MNKFLTLLLILSLYNCNQPVQQDASDSNTNNRELIPDQDPEQNPDNQKVEQFEAIITEADKLRLRSKPSLKGEILETLPINTVLKYLTKTDTEEKIQIKGLDHSAPWINVRTTTGKEGWVYGSKGLENNYGAMIRFLTSENKSGNPIELVSKISSAELEQLTGLKGIVPDVNYAGYYRYKHVNGKKQLNGAFEFIFRHYNDNYKFWLSNNYSGQYNSGFPKGKIQEFIEGVEGATITTIEYKGGSFDCKRIVQTWESEGERGFEENDQPETCSFDSF